MRNTTKLKTILIRYTVTLDLNEEEQFVMTLTDKNFGESHQITAANYSSAMSKAYSFLLKELKKEEKLSMD